MSPAGAQLTPDEQEALRRRCTVFVTGAPPVAPGAELIRVGQWCGEHGHVPDRYGQGPLIDAFERRIAAHVGCEAAVFMPSGTMAQQIALRIHAEETGVGAFAMHATSHVELHEMRAYARVQRLDAVLLGPPSRPTLAADLAAWPERLAALLVELPAREIGGQLPSLAELRELSALARSRGIRMHMDGARLWEASAAYAPLPCAEVGALFDSIYVSFYKGIGALAGAALAGPAAFVAQARGWRRRMGGTLVQLHPYVASAAMRFDAQLARIPAWRDRALRLAAALSQVPGVRVWPDPPHVNMFHLHLASPAEALVAARDEIARQEGAWMGGRFAPGATAGTSVLEIYVAEAQLDVPDARACDLFADLLARAGAVA